MDGGFWTDCVSGAACFLPIRQAVTLSRFLQRQSSHLRTSKQRANNEFWPETLEADHGALCPLNQTPGQQKRRGQSLGHWEQRGEAAAIRRDPRAEPQKPCCHRSQRPGPQPGPAHRCLLTAARGRTWPALPACPRSSSSNTSLPITTRRKPASKGRGVTRKPVTL